MKKSQLLIIIALLLLLLAINQIVSDNGQKAALVGGLPWYGWVGFIFLLITLGLLFAQHAAARAHHLLEQPTPPDLQEFQQRVERAKKRREKYDPSGPEYPHPFIVESDCIACNACIEACPHDVLTMKEKRDKNGFVAQVVRRDLCMEDTSCEAVCPTSPKACIVINSTKEIKILSAPARNKFFMTNVEGCYVIGDISGVPLIKNAVKEGAEVIQHIVRDLKNSPPEPKAKLPVAIIGIGPAGLSAVLAAKQQNLEFLGLEQGRVLSTIEEYPRNKHIEFKPDYLQTCSSLKMNSAGDQRENILKSWTEALIQSDIKVNKNEGEQSVFDLESVNVINEKERCTGVKRAEDGDYFIISTNRGSEDEERTYLARRVILSIGLRGIPMKLGGPGGKMLPGEELKIIRKGKEVKKVIYKLSNPEEFRNCKLIVVGGGNSAIETAVDLVARRVGDKLEFLPALEINDVTMLVRSDFTKDVKFRNKQQIYECKDKGKIRIRFRTVIKEIRKEGVVITDSHTKQEEILENDYIFAMIGSERPDKFLKDNYIHMAEAGE